MRRLAAVLVILLAWAAFGFGVNRFLDSRKSRLAARHVAVSPTHEKPRFSLPGVIYVSQAGRLYRLQGGTFEVLPLPAADGAWMQPAAAGPGRLLLVARAEEYSDVYLVDAASGQVVRRLTNNVTPHPSHVELNAWSFWPHLATDGATVVSAYDGPKTGTTYEVHFAVWSGALAGNVERTQWTAPTLYTGGDVSPVPTPSGGVVYTSYALDARSQIVSRIAFVSRPGATPVYLTAQADDCGQPALSADGTHLAVICTADRQTDHLEVIPLTATGPAPPVVVVASCLCASPAWSPDGSSLLYLAPRDATGHFQLWWVDRAATPAPAPPRAITQDLDLDATSAPAWAAA